MIERLINIIKNNGGIKCLILTLFLDYLVNDKSIIKLYDNL